VNETHCAPTWVCFVMTFVLILRRNCGWEGDGRERDRYYQSDDTLTNHLIHTWTTNTYKKSKQQKTFYQD